ncbi:hypothetical protein Tco_1427010, partial [Tanacetum coccineum]
MGPPPQSGRFPLQGVGGLSFPVGGGLAGPGLSSSFFTAPRPSVGGTGIDSAPMFGGDLYTLGDLMPAMASFMDVVVETNAWIVIKETLVSYFIKLVGLCMGMLQNDPSALYRYITQANDPEHPTFTAYESFLLFMSCHILASILDASIKGKPVTESTSGSILANPGTSVVYHYCFLPQLLKACVSEKALEISVHGQDFILSRWRSSRSISDLDKDGRISGAEAVAFFQASILPKHTLAQ